jgi:hypothetical protein
MLENTPSTELLFKMAAAVGQLAGSKVQEAEAKGALSDEVVGALVESGLLKVLRPRIFGGYELDSWTYVELVREILGMTSRRAGCTAFWRSTNGGWPTPIPPFRRKSGAGGSLKSLWTRSLPWAKPNG